MKKENNINTSSFDNFINFAKFTGKCLCQNLFFNKVAGLRLFIKKETLVQVFSCKFCEISKNTFLRTAPVAASIIDGAIPLRNFEFRKKNVPLFKAHSKV